MFLQRHWRKIMQQIVFAGGDGRCWTSFLPGAVDPMPEGKDHQNTPEYTCVYPNQEFGRGRHHKPASLRMQIRLPRAGRMRGKPRRRAESRRAGGGTPAGNPAQPAEDSPRAEGGQPRPSWCFLYCISWIQSTPGRFRCKRILYFLHSVHRTPDKTTAKGCLTPLHVQVEN